MIIEVITRSLTNPDDVSRRQFDLYDHAGRTWMAKHSWWAAHSGYSVTTSAVVETQNEGMNHAGI